MFGIIIFHIVMFGLGLIVASRIVSPEQVSNALGYLHKSIGITTPASEQVRMIALIWIGSIIVMVDGCLFLLVFLARTSIGR
jgi:hypothetical protein